MTPPLPPVASSAQNTRKPSRRELAMGLDELEREASQFERTCLQMLNAVRRLQGKAPVKVRD